MGMSYGAEADAAQKRPGLATYETGWKCVGFLPDPNRTFTQVFASRLKQAEAAGRTGSQLTAFTVIKADAWELKSRPVRYRRAGRMMLHAARELQRAGVVPGDRVLLCV